MPTSQLQTYETQPNRKTSNPTILSFSTTFLARCDEFQQLKQLDLVEIHQIWRVLHTMRVISLDSTRSLPNLARSHGS